MGKMFKIKVYEPARALSSELCRLDGYYCHPNRIRTTIAYQTSPSSEFPGALMLCQIGASGSFPFINNVCDCFKGGYHAEIVGEFNGDIMQSDEFEPWDISSSFSVLGDK